MIRTEGIVLSERNAGESSKALKVYTLDAGLVTIYAKGALKRSSKVTSSSQVFFVNEYTISKSGVFYYIKSANILSSNLHLRQSLVKLSYANLVLEIYLKSNMEEIENKNAYLLLKKYLETIEDSTARVRTMQLLLKYISFIGFRPAMKGKYFLVDGGGLSPNLEYSSKYYELNDEEVEYLNLLMYKDLEFEFQKKDFERKIFHIIIEYIKYCLDLRQINSLELIREE
ncbi:DNA repair protein RecO [Peptoniphilus duerdenii ATCC BAA-1640]|uniref:DNA repair protein RecO n=1 Tax=Peptoniphilus duerdenii ATCC BAA-1640 TaxID=862517 RepID=E0NLI8_9FIRM|nr:DNA repair protein RecO [Peptoniphilus duerdenii]EFM25378.1 DNA repair protein RecO [Peptoniphilus duerdenii ATCC BAA-1640]